MSEQIGKHKGAVETLLHEKKELSRLLQIVNSQLQRHLSALEEAGIDTDQLIKEVQEQGQKNAGKNKTGGKSKSQRSKRKQDSSSKNRGKNPQEDDEEADELLEGEEDFSDRDFNPR